jgi:hypothetical protein
MDKNEIGVEKRMMGVPLNRGARSFHAGSGPRLCRTLPGSSCLPALVAVLVCVLWGNQAAVAVDGTEKQARIRQTAEQQRDIREEALRTVAVLKELSEELVSNRFRDPALTKSVSGVEGALEKAGNEYMEKSEQNLKALLNLAGDAALKGKLDEVLRLQDIILNMLTQIRNARIAADKSRLQRLLEVALRNQRGVMERTKAILFNPQERVPGGKAPDALTLQEKERLNQVAGLQGMTHHSVQKAVAEFLAASAIQDAKMPQQAEAARKIHAYLAQAKVVDKAAQAQSDLERNRSTQALVTETEVIQILESAIGSLAKVAGDMDNKLSELAQEREEVADLLAKQREIRKDTEALPATAKAEAMKGLEAREDRLAKTAEELKEKADEKTLARATMEQVKKAMEKAEEKLSKGEKAPALEEMKAAEKGMEAALMALEKQMEDIASEKKESAEAAEKKADELRKEAEAAAKMSKDLEAAAKQEEEIRKDTQQAADEKKDAQTPSADEKKDAQTPSADEKKDAQTPSADEKKDAQTPSAEQQQKMAQIAAEQDKLQQQVKAMQQSADQQKKSMPESMQEASQKMEQAQQAMQQASQQLKQNKPEGAQAPEQAAQKALEQAADAMKKMEQALRQMEQAQRDAATAAKLNEMAEKQAGLQQQADKAQDPSAMKNLKKAQQDLANELSQMRKKEPGLGPKAQEAEDAMKKAQSQLEAEEKAMGSGQPPQQPPKDSSGMPAAKKEMMNAQAALQQMASQMSQSAQQAQQSQKGPKDSKPSSEKDSTQASQAAKGEHNRGDPTVKLGDKVNSRGWEAAMSERDRVKFGQNADRAFPPEYAKLLEGYYRRLATDKK